MVQAIYHDTGLTPDDVIDAYVRGDLRMFNVKPHPDDLHVMLYPERYPDVKIQVSRFAANVWSPSFDHINDTEDLLNKTFGDSFNPKPFKERKILLNPGDLRKILETPLGLVSTFAYYCPSVIADAVYQAIQNGQLE